VRAVAVATAAMVGMGGCLGGNGGSDGFAAAGLDSVVISGGGMTGIYFSYGGGLGKALSDRYGVGSEVLQTGGSIENLRNLANGSAQLAFSTADAAADATAGREPFSEAIPVRAVARVYDDFVHLVVPASSDIEAIWDLRGRTVSLGAEGSGTEIIAGRLLAAAGVATGEIVSVSLGIDESIDAMRSGDIEAFFWSGGLPTPGVQELAADLPIRLVPLREVVEAVRSKYGSGYRHGVVPEGTYGLDEDVATMAVPNFLMVRADLADDVAYEIVDTLFDERAAIAQQVPAAALLDRSRAIFTEPVDLHPGALRYYRDTKV
jgi:hypothetical protein